MTIGALPIVSSTKPKKAAVEARSVLSCIQAKVTRRTRNREENGHPTKISSRWCAISLSWDAYLRIFVAFFARKPGTVHHEKGTRSSSTALQLRYSPTAGHFIKIRETHGLNFNVIRKGSAVREALGHLYTNSVMRTSRCGPKNSRDVKRGSAPKVFSKFVETSRKTERHSSDQKLEGTMTSNIKLEERDFCR